MLSVLSDNSVACLRCIGSNCISDICDDRMEGPQVRQTVTLQAYHHQPHSSIPHPPSHSDLPGNHHEYPVRKLPTVPSAAGHGMSNSFGSFTNLKKAPRFTVHLDRP